MYTDSLPIYCNHILHEYYTLPLGYLDNSAVTTPKPSTCGRYASAWYVVSKRAVRCPDLRPSLDDDASLCGPFARPRRSPCTRPRRTSLLVFQGLSSFRTSINLLVHFTRFARDFDTRILPSGSCHFATQLCDMLDDPESLPVGAGCKRLPPRRVLVITNPNDRTADSSTRPFFPLLRTSIQYPDTKFPRPRVHSSTKYIWLKEHSFN